MLNTVSDVARIHMLLFYLLSQHSVGDKDKDSDVYTLYFNAGAIDSFIQQICMLICCVPSLFQVWGIAVNKQIPWPHGAPLLAEEDKKYISKFYSLLEGNTCYLRKRERRKKGKRKKRKGRTA